MKNLKILATAAFMTISSFAIAQEKSNDYRENIYFGLKAGLNVSNIYDSNEDDFNADGKLGMVGGAVLNMPISKYFGIQPEFLFSQKGFKGSGTFLGSEYNFTRTTSYIDIPLQLTFKASEFATFVAGPQFSYLINQKDVFDNSAGSFTHEEDFKNDNIRKNILGFVAGMDLYLDGFIIGGRVGWDFQDNHGDGTSDTPRYKNAWLQGTIGYTLFK
ncbi:porin family protein [Marivirga tractuosa]|uniref:porin family protein n=1 Tax=Marivirga tractuosa TaxID=1006 RepID=UPI0035D09BF9